MADFEIFCDTGCDIPLSLRESLGIKNINFTFVFDGDKEIYDETSMPIKEFYEKMRNGAVARTSAANFGQLDGVFRSVVSEGKDVVYLCFSSGLSSTATTAAQIAEDLHAEFPERTIEVVDTLCASGSIGLLAMRIAELRDQGVCATDAADQARKIFPTIDQWFTVDDLSYLERGGRISKVAAFAAATLNIKPVMHTADDGKLYVVSKAKGRKKSIAAMRDAYLELALTPNEGPYCITHTDCEEEALELERLIEEKTGVKATYITYIGTAIGSHVGPGTLAVFFYGSKR